MSELPRSPEGNASAFPTGEPLNPTTGSTGYEPAGPGTTSLEQGVASAKAAIGPLADKATAFARARPWATAALVGTVALAVLNTLRGKRA